LLDTEHAGKLPGIASKAIQFMHYMFIVNFVVVYIVFS